MHEKKLFGNLRFVIMFTKQRYVNTSVIKIIQTYMFHFTGKRSRNT